MFESVAEQDDRPDAIRRFEQLWFIAIFLSALISIQVFDFTIQTVGLYPALLTIAAFFAASIIMMVFVSRRRSNVARFLTIPFLLLILLYDLSLYFNGMVNNEFGGFYSLVTFGRVGLMVLAISLLFTPSSRAWFAERSSPTVGVEEG